jgi:hypothetical protein
MTTGFCVFSTSRAFDTELKILWLQLEKRGEEFVGQTKDEIDLEAEQTEATTHPSTEDELESGAFGQ